jgi:hypothetical protein
VLNPPILIEALAQKTSADFDTLYLWQARKELDFPHSAHGEMCPRKKHLNIKYHFFHLFIQRGILIIEHIAGELQMADILTKALEVVTFQKN